MHSSPGAASHGSPPHPAPWSFQKENTGPEDQPPPLRRAPRLDPGAAGPPRAGPAGGEVGPLGDKAKQLWAGGAGEKEAEVSGRNPPGEPGGQAEPPPGHGLCWVDTGRSVNAAVGGTHVTRARSARWGQGRWARPPHRTQVTLPSQTFIGPPRSQTPPRAGTAPPAAGGRTATGLTAVTSSNRWTLNRFTWDVFKDRPRTRAIRRGPGGLGVGARAVSCGQARCAAQCPAWAEARCGTRRATGLRGRSDVPGPRGTGLGLQAMSSAAWLVTGTLATADKPRESHCRDDHRNTPSAGPGGAGHCPQRGDSGACPQTPGGRSGARPVRGSSGAAAATAPRTGSS